MEIKFKNKRYQIKQMSYAQLDQLGREMVALVERMERELERALKSKRPVDKEWLERHKYALRFKKNGLKAISRQMDYLRSRKKTTADCFIDVAYQVLDRATFNLIMEQAKLRLKESQYPSVDGWIAK